MWYNVILYETKGDKERERENKLSGRRTRIIYRNSFQESLNYIDFTIFNTL